MLVTYGAGSNPVTPKDGYQGKEEKEMMKKGKENISELMETVFILYGKIYIIINDDNNHKKRD